MLRTQPPLGASPGRAAQTSWMKAIVLEQEEEAHSKGLPLPWASPKSPTAAEVQASCASLWGDSSSQAESWSRSFPLLPPFPSSWSL